MQAAEPSEQFLRRPMRAKLVAIRLPAGAPRHEQGDGPEGDQAGRMAPAEAVASPPGEERERQQLTEP